MADALEKLEVAKKTGSEHFRSGDSSLDFSVLDFWRWSASDLIGNTARGILAEYIVARALKISTDKEVRDEWAPFDLETPDGIKIEVKSAAYVQSWEQSRLSRISFGTPKTRAWDPESGNLRSEPKRHADAYVFALFAQQEMPIEPLDLDQWKFYALSATKLDERKSISLSALEELASPVPWRELADAVSKAAGQD
ncbi:MAG: hypothetical protein OXG62_13575 [Nitrospinae bacterium]|nr:hypothetical protein [Nitrospinota bacterium]